MILNLSEHQVESVTLGQLLVCAKTRLADDWGDCIPLSSVPAASLAPSSTNRGELEVRCLLCLCRASGLETSCCYCCFHTDEGNSWCPETVVCPLLLEILDNAAIIIARTWETWDVTVLTFSRRRVDAIFSEPICVCTLLKPIYITVLGVYSFSSLCAETWKLARAQIEDDEGHRMKLKRRSLSWTPGKVSCQWKVFCSESNLRRGTVESPSAGVFKTNVKVK